MSNLVVTLLFDGALALLLVVTITCCWRLSKRIRMLQDSRGELAQNIARFDQATARASASLTELQTVSKRITDALQLKIEKANFLADDLAFMIEKSTKLAAQLEQQTKPRPATPPAAPAPAAKPAQTKPHPVFEAQMTGPRPSEAPKTSAGAQPQSPLTASLEAILQRLSSGAASTPPLTGPIPPRRIPPAPTQSNARTDAERELLDALKSGR